MILLLPPIIGQIQGSSFTWTSLLTALISGVVGSLIGGFITIWYKKEEIEIQKKAFEESGNKNINELKLELIKIKDLRKEYELSLEKHTYEKLKQVLEFAQSQSDVIQKDKIEALKFYNNFLNDIYKNLPTFFDSMDEYKEWISYNTYKRLGEIKKNLKLFDSKYIHAYPAIVRKIKQTITEAENLELSISELSSSYDENIFQATYEHAESFISYKESLYEILEELQSEFEELEKIKREFIRSHIK